MPRDGPQLSKSHVITATIGSTTGGQTVNPIDVCTRMAGAIRFARWMRSCSWTFQHGQPDLRAGEITPDRIRLFELPGRYPIYFVSFGLLPRYRRTKAYKLLLESLFDVVRGLAADGIVVDQVCANAFTASGEAMCKTFGMSPVAQHSDKGRVFLSTMSDILAKDVCRQFSNAPLP